MNSKMSGNVALEFVLSICIAMLVIGILISEFARSELKQKITYTITGHDYQG